MAPRDDFDRAFAPWASRVRARRSLSLVLTGVALGLVLSAGAAGTLWKLRRGDLRPWALSLGLVGGAVGLVAASRRRFRDEDVALYLDARLRTGELVATALEARGATDPAREAILTRAAKALGEGDRKQVRPPVLRPLQAVGPLAAAAAVWVSLVPVPPAPAAPPPPGSDKVVLAEVSGLEKVAALGALSARDDEQKKRLEKIAKDAAALREKLRQGEERREALAEIARLQDAVSAERLSLGDGDRRQGLEAALGRLAQDPLTKDAAKALGDRDLVRFDEEMQKIANTREKSDRDRAKKALEEAAEAAKKAGSGDVAKALEAQRDLMEKRGQRADELRELQKALEGTLTEEQRRDLEEFGNPSNDADSKKMAKSLSDALKKLTPEERKRLAERLKKQMAQNGGGMAPSSKERLEDMSRDLGTPEGQKKLEEELKRLANEKDEDSEAERQKKLDDAQRGLGEAQRGMGGMPMPMPGSGQDGAGKGPPGGANSGGGPPGGRGGKDEKGTGDHVGQSKDVKGDELRSRAQAKVNAKAPTAGITIGRTAGREGDLAGVQGNGAIGKANPSDVSGVDANEVPEEYREQVGRYFTPLVTSSSG